MITLGWVIVYSIGTLVSGHMHFSMFTSGMVHAFSTDADCSDDARLRNLLDSDDYHFRFECGLCKPSSMLNVSQKKEIIAALTLHYLVFKSIGRN